MSIIDKIISRQVVDKFVIEPGWREGREIPLEQLTPEERWEILRDTRGFRVAVADRIEVQDKWLPAPIVELGFNPDGQLALTITGLYWRFKK